LSAARSWASSTRWSFSLTTICGASRTTCAAVTMRPSVETKKPAPMRAVVSRSVHPPHGQPAAPLHAPRCRRWPAVEARHRHPRPEQPTRECLAKVAGGWSPGRSRIVGGGPAAHAASAVTSNGTVNQEIAQRQEGIPGGKVHGMVLSRCRIDPNSSWATAAPLDVDHGLAIAFARTVPRASTSGTYPASAAPMSGAGLGRPE
jgi:hypothetical protein